MSGCAGTGGGGSSCSGALGVDFYYNDERVSPIIIMQECQEEMMLTGVKAFAKGLSFDKDFAEGA